MHTSLGKNGDRWLEALASVYAARFGEPAPLPLADVEHGVAGFYDSYSDDTDGRSSRALAAARLHDRGTLGRGTLGQGRAWHLEALAFLQWRRLELEENYTGFELYPDAGDRRLQVHDATGGGVEVQGSLALSGAWSLVAGAGSTLELMRQAEDQILASGTAWQHNRMLDAWQTTAHGYAGVQAALTPALMLRAGGRAHWFSLDAEDALVPERSQRKTMAALLPRLSAAWPVRPAWAMFAALGRGLRPPEARSVLAPAPRDDPGDMDERFYDGSEPRVSVSHAAELGARWQPGQHLRMGASTFAIWLDSEMLFDHVSGVVVELAGTRRLAGAGPGALARRRAAPLPGIPTTRAWRHGRLPDRARCHGRISLVALGARYPDRQCSRLAVARGARLSDLLALEAGARQRWLVRG